MYARYLKQGGDSLRATQNANGVGAAAIAGSVNGATSIGGVHYYGSVAVKEKHLTLNPPQTKNLIGRKSMLTFISNKLKTMKKILITGMGGIGKSELCRTYYWQREATTRHIGWINYTGDLRIDFVSQIRVPGGYDSKDTLDEKFRQACSYLNELPDDSLLVIDNLDKQEEKGLEQLAAFNIQVLISARGKLKWFEDRHISLGFLKVEDYRKLFCHYYRKPIHDVELLDKIIHRAGQHTLMLEMMAKTALCLSAEEFLEELERKGIDLSETIPAEIDVNWSKTPALLYEHLQKLFDMSKLQDKEKAVIHQLSLFAPVPMERDFIKEMICRESFIQMQSLIDKGWLETDKDLSYVWMHPILREVVQSIYEFDSSEYEPMLEKFIAVLTYKETDNPLLKSKYIVHGESILHILKDISTELLGQVANNIASILSCMGKYDEALKWQKKAVFICERVLDVNNSLLGNFYNNLSMIYQDMKKYKKALEWQKKAIAIDEKILKEDDPGLAASYNNLSCVYHGMREYEGALEWQMKAIAIGEKILKEDHPGLAASYNNLSGIYRDMGNYKEALTCQRKTIAICERVLEVNHPNLAVAYENLSGIYRGMGNYREALTWQKKAIIIREKVLAEDHPDLIDSYKYLSSIYRVMRKYEEAIIWNKKVIAIKEKAKEIDYSTLANAFIHLSFIYRLMGKDEEALEWEEKAGIIIKKGQENRVSFV